MASVSSLNSVNKKRALLIGNNNYSEGGTLRYSINNANDLRDKLCTIHFQVTLGIDLTCEQMDSIIEHFLRDICSGDLVIFFFSGYGTHWNGQNFFIPIDDQQIKSPEMFKDQTVNVQTMVEMVMGRSPSAAVFLFDCCRSYLIPKKGLSRCPIDFGGLSMMQPLPASFIIFTCDSDKVILDKSTNGRNDIFISHLLEYVDQSNLPIDEMMDLISDGIMDQTNDEQCPFRVSALRKNVYLNYQIQAGFNQQRNSRLQESITQSQLRSLVDLRQQQLTDRDMKIVVQQIIINKQCTSLCLGENKITSVGASILASALNNNKTLERLYLEDNRVSDMGIRSFSKILSNNNNIIKILGLQQNLITDSGVTHLAKMIKTNTILTGLLLSKNEITDIGVKLLADALNNSNKTLEYLDLSNNKLITDLSVVYLIDMIEHNRALNELSIYDCHLSRTAKKDFRKRQNQRRISVFMSTVGMNNKTIY